MNGGAYQETALDLLQRLVTAADHYGILATCQAMSSCRRMEGCGCFICQARRVLDESRRPPGRTSEQIARATPSAIFIWPVAHTLDYAKKLAAHLGRSDLQVVAPAWLDSNQWQGKRFSSIVVDHACQLSQRERRCLRAIAELTTPSRLYFT